MYDVNSSCDNGLIDEEREKAKNANKKVCDRTVEYTGREGSARDIRKEKKCLSGMEKNRKKAPKQKFIILGEVIKVGEYKDMYEINFASLVSQVSKE